MTHNAKILATDNATIETLREARTLLEERSEKNKNKRRQTAIKMQKFVTDETKKAFESVLLALRSETQSAVMKKLSIRVESDWNSDLLVHLNYTDSASKNVYTLCDVRGVGFHKDGTTPSGWEYNEERGNCFRATGTKYSPTDPDIESQREYYINIDGRLPNYHKMEARELACLSDCVKLVTLIANDKKVQKAFNIFASELVAIRDSLRLEELSDDRDHFTNRIEVDNHWDAKLEQAIDVLLLLDSLEYDYTKHSKNNLRQYSTDALKHSYKKSKTDCIKNIMEKLDSLEDVFQTAQLLLVND